MTPSKKSAFQIEQRASFEPVIVPPVFIPKIGGVHKDWEDMTAEEQEYLQEKVKTIWGDESEKMAFSNFSHLLSEGKYEETKIFSLNGIEYMFPNSNLTEGKTGEFDQIIVVDVIKTVIYVEYKRTFNAAHAKRKRQFEHFRKLFEDHFPHDEGWKLVTSYGFTKWPDQGQSESARRPCKDCERFVFMSNDLNMMKKWLDSLLSKAERSGETKCCLKSFDMHGIF